MYKSLPALVAHLLQSAEKATTSKDRAKAQGMAKKNAVLVICGRTWSHA